MAQGGGGARQHCPPPRPGWRVPSRAEEDATRFYNNCMRAQEGVCWAAARQVYQDADHVTRTERTDT